MVQRRTRLRKGAICLIKNLLETDSLPQLLAYLYGLSLELVVFFCPWLASLPPVRQIVTISIFAFKTGKNRAIESFKQLLR